ncbi:MAG: helix-turn-helix domain-containing protein [Nanoarchaeota archaeon]
MNRDFKGVWIPKEIYLDDNLNWTEKILLIEIDSLDNEKGCYASNKYFADFIGKSKNWVSQCISKLKKDGYIYQEDFDGRTRILRSNLKYVTQSKSGFEKNQRGGLSKVKGGETSSSQSQHNSKGKKNTSINISNNLKIEEEEARMRAKKKIPDKIQQKFNQVFNRELSVEFYEKMLKIYSDTKILFKALRVAEEKADKPCYLLKILKDWQKEGLTSVSSINDYLKERQDKKQNQHSNKSYPNKNTKSVVPDRSLEEMYEDGWK